MSFVASVHAKAIELIKLSIDMTSAAGTGHPTSAASLAHLVTFLMYNHLRYDPMEPDHPGADRLVLSEGHACPIVYAAGADLGLAIGRERQQWRPMTREDALRLRAPDSEIDGHPNPAEGFPFFPAATGSLGQGLSVATGMALAARLDGFPKRIFCLIGDGESREGQIWEAADFLVDHHLTAVCPIFNCNGYGQSAAVSRQQTAQVTAARLRAMGFSVAVIDGHNPEDIQQALQEHAMHSERAEGSPFALVANTTKGWGFTSVLGSDVHGKPVAKDEKAQAFAALDATGERLKAHWTAGDLRIPPLPEAFPQPSSLVLTPPTFQGALQAAGQEAMLDSGKVATRKAYGIALRALGHAKPQVVALDGDVSNSTYSEIFRDDPALTARFFECRIAEQHMISCAGGLAAAGKVPFVSSFGKFLIRGYDQLEMGFISRFNLKLVGSHCGVTLAADGPSQMALADVAFFRAWTTINDAHGRPFLYLLQPADAYAAYALTIAMGEHNGPCYMRTLRPDVPFLYDDTTPFSLGGHHVLSQGSDMLIVASGYMVHEASKALKKLREHDIEATLVDLYSLPFDETALLLLAQKNAARVLTVEDNYGGGIGAAIAELLARHGGASSLTQMHVRHIPKSSYTPEEALHAVHLSAEDIVATCLQSLDVAAR